MTLAADVCYSNGMATRKSFHGQQFDYEPGRTVIHYENGFCQGGTVYDTPATAHVIRNREQARQNSAGWRATNHQYVVE